MAQNKKMKLDESVTLQSTVHDEQDGQNNLQHQFAEYQVELDCKNDKHERLVKLSRDITIASKRCIFLLHRVLDDPSKQHEVLDEAERKLDQIQANQWSKIIAEINSDDMYLYARAYWPGLEEYIEAITYYYYLKENRLVTLTDLVSIAPFPGRLLTAYDFAAGIKSTVGYLG